ncbi:Vomp family autotransporter [Bartonella sp. B39]
MKKLYATRTASNMKSSRFSFVNVSLLAAMTAFLSSVFPVFAGNFDLIEQVLQSMRNATAVYSQANDRSIVSAYDSHNSDVDLFDNPSVPKARYLAALNRLGTLSATDSDYANFLTKMLLSKNGADANIIDVSDASRSGVIREDFRISALGTNNTILGNSESITFMDSDRVPAGQLYAVSLGDKSVASGKNSISIGQLTQSLGNSSAAIDSAFNDSNGYNNEKDKESVYTIAKDDYSLVIGATSKALAHGATVLGYRSYGLGDRSTSIGYYSEARTAGSVALGAYSLSDVVAGVAGYSPLLKKNATDTSLAWKSTQGAVSVGSSDENITRQIIRVAAGTQDTDAVNVAQLKSLQDYVDKGWKLLVGGMDYTAVSVDKTVDFSAGSSNLNITKDEDDNKLKFDLAEDITLSSAKVGEDTLDATDLIIANSPEITTTGIDAANKKITNVATGTQDTDIVNFTLLKAAQETAVIKGLQINTTGKDFADATAAAENSVALGSKASVDKLSSGSLALGVGASVKDYKFKDYKSNKDSVLGSLNGIALGAGASVSGAHGVAIGAGAKSEGAFASVPRQEDLIDAGGVAIGVSTESVADSIAIGSRARALGYASIALGLDAKVEREVGEKAGRERIISNAIAFGYRAQVSVYNGIALGSYSVADVESGSMGYDPRLRKGLDIQNNTWIAGLGALSIGDIRSGNTRKIVGVAAGSEDTDAVNVAQLKALQESEALSWELSVNGANATIVNSINSMDLVTGSSNLNITKGDNDNKVKFDLAQNVIVNSVEVGKGTLDAKGLKIDGIVLDETGLHLNEGLQITTTGINAASSKITNVENGTDDNDAVNFSQLKEIKQQIASSSFVKQNTETKHITIGAEAEGDKIDITNKDKENRTLTGIKAGALSATSTEAVTGSQLFDTNNKFATYFGGGTRYENGTWTPPTFKVTTIKEDGGSEDKDYSDIASVFAGVGSSFTNVSSSITKAKDEISKKIDNVITDVKGNSLVKKEDTTNRITIGKEVEGSEINIANKSGADRTLSGVKEATQNNEAVNKGQFDKGLKDFSNSLQSDDSAVVHYDKKKSENDTIDYTSVTLGKGNGSTAVGLHNVADGNISKGSRDAITGGQIDKISQDVAKYLGGDAAFTNGAFTGPIYKLSKVDTDGNVKNTDFNDVGTAFEELDTSIKNVNQRIKEVSQGVAQDSLSWSKDDGAFVAKHGDGSERTNSKIRYLAAGELSESSTDAVTGSQLYSTNQKVDTVTSNLQTAATNIAKSFGGGTKYENGTWTPPTFKVTTIKEDGSSEEKAYNNVSDALVGVGSSFTNVQDKFTSEITTQINNAITDVKGDSLVKKDKATNLITIGKEIDGDKIDITNKNKENRTLTGIKDGALSASSTDAVNGSQLFETNSNVTKNTTDLAQANNYIFRNAADIVQVKTDIWSLDTNISQYLGGGADVLVGKAPTFTVKGATYRDVGSAFAGIDKNALLWDDSEGSFVAKHGEKGKETSSKIKYLAAGDLSASSTDAVNGSQLFETNDKFATYFGGGTKYENGTWTSPTFKVTTIKEDGNSEDKDYSDIASVFADVGTSFTNVNSSITKVKDEISKKIDNAITDVKGNSLVKKDKVTNLITIGKEVEGDKIDITNKDKNQRTLTGVKDGALSATSTEAVTGSQLFKTNNDVTEAKSNITKNTTDIAKANSNISSINKNISQYLGGGADVLEGKKPSYTVQDTTYDNVTSAFAGVDSSITKIHNEIAKKVDRNALLWDDSEGSFVAQHGDGSERTNSKIKYLAAGDLSESSTDAVTGSQLYSTNQKVDTVTSNLQTAATNIAKSFGGGTKYEDGTWTPPTFKVTTIKEDGNSESKDYPDIASVFADVGTSFTNVNSSITKAKNEISKEINNAITDVKGDSLVKKEGTTNRITIGKEVEGSEINIANNSGADRTLSGVKEATQNNEAVNKGQFDKGLKDFSNSLQSDDSAVVHYDKKKNENDTIDYTSVTLGKGNGSTAVGLHNVADGNISKGSRDAITGGQIDKISQDVAKYLGGDAAFTNGAFTGPIYKLSKVDIDGNVENATFNDVGTAFDGLDTSIKNVNQRIKEVSQGVAQDSLSWSKNDSAFVAQHGDGSERTNSKIKYLAAGELSESSTDAVTGSQLFETNSNVTKNTTDLAQANNDIFRNAADIVHVKTDIWSLGTNISQYLGGGADVLQDKKPSYTVQGTEYNDVGSAFAGVSSSITDVHNEIKTEINKVISDSLVKQDEKTHVINIGKEVEGSEINIANNEGAERTLSGVKEATQNNEAVNKGQLDKSLKDLSANIQSGDSAVVLYDKKEGDNGETDYTSVTFGKGKGSAPVGLHNVADGNIASGSHDAVNGGQINTISQDVAKFLGGEAAFSNGVFTAPTYKISNITDDGTVTDKSHNDVDSAFAGLDASVKNVNTHLTNEVKKFDEKITNIAQHVKGDALLWSKSDNAFIALHGEEDKKTNSKIKFLANGDITDGSTDAVTGGQLHTLGTGVASTLGGSASYENGIWTAPTFKVKIVNEAGTEVEDKDYSSVAAAFEGIGTSFANLHKEVTESNTEVTEQIKQNALLWSDADNAFVALHEKDGAKVNGKITHLQAGELSAISTEAVNGSQLYSLNETLAKYFGGGAGYDAEGNWQAPSFIVKTVKEGGESKETSYTNVSEALTGVGSSITNVKNELTAQINNEISSVKDENLVKQDKTTHLINLGKEVEGSEINITNKNGIDRILSGVKAAENDNEAVNKGQLDKSLAELSANIQSDDSAVVLYDKKEDGETNYTSVTFGKGNDSAPVGLHNVADGQIASGSHDAVNGGQIDKISQDVAQYLGGDAGFKDGAFTGLTYKLSEVDADGQVLDKSFNDVGSAFTGLDMNIKNVNSNLTNKFNELNQSITNITEEVKGDALLWDKEEEAFVVKHGKDGAKTNSKITHLADGNIASGSTEAVTGGQLYSLKSTLAKYFDGGAGYDAEGNWQAPSFIVKTVKEGGESEETSYTSVAEALTGVGSSITNVKNELTTQINNEINNVVSESLVKQDTDTHVIAIGAEKNGTKVTLANIDGAARTLTGVRTGALSANSTDAVNGSQLYSLNKTLATYFGGDAGYEDGEWKAPSFIVKIFGTDGTEDEKSYDNVAEAFAGVNTAFTNIKNEVNNKINNVVADSLVKQDADTKIIKIGGEKSGTKVTLANVDAAARTLTGVKAGALSELSTDAVNGSQVYFLNQTLAAYFGGGAGYNDGKWTGPTFNVVHFKEDGTADDKKHGYNSVAEAFDGVSGSMLNINDRIRGVEKNVASNGLNWNKAEGAYDGRHNEEDSKITHVADGKVEEGSKEVVNGGQLWETNKKVTAVEDKVNTIDKKVQGVAVAADGAVKYDKDSDGKKKNRITLVGGDESAPVLIDNVGDGTIETGSKEAVNGGQLHDYTEQQMKIVLDDANKYTDERLTNAMGNVLNDVTAYTDMKFEALSYGIEDVRKEARQAAAIGLAVSNLRYNDTPGKLSVAFGTGVWLSQSAFAIGAGYTSEDGNVRSNLSVTSAGGQWGVGVGISLTLN